MNDHIWKSSIPRRSCEISNDFVFNARSFNLFIFEDFKFISTKSQKKKTGTLNNKHNKILNKQII